VFNQAESIFAEIRLTHTDTGIESGQTCCAQSMRAQSSFRFERTPEFMLLRALEDRQVYGFARSLWQEGNISFVVGDIGRAGELQLSFYRQRLDDSRMMTHATAMSTRCVVLRRSVIQDVS